MADIKNHTIPETVAAIFAAYEAQERQHRPHLGASQIGHHCDRYLWYQFRWCESPDFDGRMLRLFDHGNWEERRLVADLRAIGCTVYEVDTETGRQINYSALGGHFGCSLDAVALGVPESPNAWHLVEFKTASDKQFQAIRKSGVEQAKPQHYAQMQAGMYLSGLSRALYLAVNKNTDDIHAERIKPDEEAGVRLMKRAERVVFSDGPLDRVSDRPDWYQCRFCEMNRICHHGETPQVNCRTCLHSTPEPDGTWSCARHSKTLTVDEQRAGCDHHLFIPALIDEPIDAGDDWVAYQGQDGEYRNGPPGPRSYTSHEMRAASIPLPLPEELEQARDTFNARIVE